MEKMTLRELGIGTLKEVYSLKATTPLIDVLNLMSKHRISAVPLVDENGNG